jgi:Skp family chaperone for outer membrane proteins
MQDFIEKMKKIAVAIGQERGYTVVLEATEGGVVYWSDSVDITDELIKRYNAANPATK